MGSGRAFPAGRAEHHQGHVHLSRCRWTAADWTWLGSGLGAMVLLSAMLSSGKYSYCFLLVVLDLETPGQRLICQEYAIYFAYLLCPSCKVSIIFSKVSMAVNLIYKESFLWEMEWWREARVFLLFPSRNEPLGCVLRGTRAYKRATWRWEIGISVALQSRQKEGKNETWNDNTQKCLPEWGIQLHIWVSTKCPVLWVVPLTSVVHNNA